MSIQQTVKELVRHIITKSGLNGLHLLARKAAGQDVRHVLPGSLSERFSQIYEHRAWLNDRPSGSLSGLGSELENTRLIRRELPKVLLSLGCQRMLDLGCGDFTWIKDIRLPCIYIGVDIVPDLIDANRAVHSSAARTFELLDATCDPLPAADTILCREVLFHRPLADVWRVVENVRASGASFSIATNDNALLLNADILSGTIGR
jgi:SAM-dependent methyltransferase